MELHVAVQDGVAVEVVCPVEPLSTYLAQEFLALRVRVREDMALELVLPGELLPTRLARDGHLLGVAT